MNQAIEKIDPSDPWFQLQIMGKTTSDIIFHDAGIRKEYRTVLSQTSNEFSKQVKLGRVSSCAAAAEANKLRNFHMEAMRGKSSEFAKSFAVGLKQQGKTLHELEVEKAKKLFNRPLGKLTQEQKTKVWTSVIESAGKTRKWVDQVSTFAFYGSRVLVTMTYAAFIYDIYQAEEKPDAMKTAAGLYIGGAAGAVRGIAVGASVGIYCGPYAPLCSGVGVIMGGLVGAMIGSGLAVGVIHAIY